MAIDRFRTRRTVTKDIPAETDLERSEEAYSFKSDRQFIRNQITGAVECIGGKAIVDMVNDLMSRMTYINSSPVVNPDTASVVDAVGTISGNVLANDSDPDGDAFSVSTVSYGSAAKTVGQEFTTPYGSLIMRADGTWLYKVGAGGHALTNGQQVVEIFSYTVIDSRGAVSRSTPLTVTIIGTNEAPVAASDSGAVPINTVASGNVLSNDTDPEGAVKTVTQFTVLGISTIFMPGDTATVPGVGTFTLSADGAYTITPAVDYRGPFPRITYTMMDGVNTAIGYVSLAVMDPAPDRAKTVSWFRQYRDGVVQPTNIALNPVQPRVAAQFPALNSTWPAWDWSLPLPSRAGADSLNLDFRVGPGMEYTEINQVPWLSLLPGDRVFIYWRSTPYKHVLPIHVRGEPARWIEVIGVRGPNGEMPVLDADAAIEDPNIVKVNVYHTAAAMLTIMPPLDGRAGANFKPGYIHIHGLEIKNVFAGKSVQRSTDGASQQWSGAAGIRVLGCDHITISGCYIHDNIQGLFVNSTPGNGERFVTRYLHCLFNHFKRNSFNGSFGEHNSYCEAIAAIHEFNYFDLVTTGSSGDMIKDRSSGNIFRYNTFRSNGNFCISIRDPDATWEIASGFYDTKGLLCQNYSFVYGNSIELVLAGVAIGHGDGAGTKHPGYERVGGQIAVYNNIFVGRYTPAPIMGWEASFYFQFTGTLFEPWNTRIPMTWHVRNNIFFSDKVAATDPVVNLSVFRWGGVPDFQSNFAHNIQPRYSPIGTQGVTNSARLNGPEFTGTLATLNLTNSPDDPGFVSFAVDDLSLLPSSVYYSLTAPISTLAIERGLICDGGPVMYPFGEEPVPTPVSAPTISGSALPSGVLTATDAVFTPNNGVRENTWLRNNVVVPGQAGMTYEKTAADVASEIRFVQKLTNSAGESSATSAPFYVVSSTTPQVTAAPVISGSTQDGFPLHLSNGSWTNNPTGFTYQWYLQDGSPVAGETSSTFTPVGKVGSSYYGEVKAYNAAGEYGIATSQPVTIIAPKSDPDAYGKFNFEGVAGTSLVALDAKWESSMTASNPFKTQVTCNGSGGLVASYAVYWNGGRAWYVNGQSDTVPVEVGVHLIAGVGVVTSFLRTHATQVGYSIAYFTDRIVVSKNDTAVATWTHTFGDVAVMKVVPVGADLQVYVNGTLFNTWTDATPLSGGYPGFSVNSGLDATSYLDYWTDSPA